MENKIFSHLLHQEYRTLLWEVESCSCIEIWIITSFEHNSALLLSGKLIFPSEFSVSFHSLSCPSEHSLVPFNSFFCWFPFQISVMGMKTKAFLKKENYPTNAQGDHLGLSFSHFICNLSLENYCDFRCHLRLCWNLSTYLSASPESHFSFIWGRYLLTLWKKHRFKNNIQGCLHASERNSLQHVLEPKWGTLVVRRTLCKCEGFPTKHFLQDWGLHKQQKNIFCISVSLQCVPSNGFR